MDALSTSSKYMQKKVITLENEALSFRCVIGSPEQCINFMGDHFESEQKSPQRHSTQSSVESGLAGVRTVGSFRVTLFSKVKN